MHACVQPTLRSKTSGAFRQRMKQRKRDKNKTAGMGHARIRPTSDQTNSHPPSNIESKDQVMKLQTYYQKKKKGKSKNKTRQRSIRVHVKPRNQRRRKKERKKEIQPYFLPEALSSKSHLHERHVSESLAEKKAKKQQKLTLRPHHNHRFCVGK